MEELTLAEDALEVVMVVVMEEEHFATEDEGIVVVFMVMGLGWGDRAWECIKEELL